MTQATEPVIQLCGVKKTYQLGKVPVEALRGVDLTVGRGEMVSIMGSSGSGKTTLLNILGLLDAPSGGMYRLSNEEVAQLSDGRRSQLRNRHIGFIFQSYNLLPRLSAVENVMIPLMYGGIKKPERLPLAEAALAAVGLADRVKHRPAELSGGEQQRVAIARALVKDPSVLLADEPTGNLDSKAGAAIMELLGQLHRERGVTIVLVTHDPQVGAMAERTIRLKDGMVDDSGNGS